MNSLQHQSVFIDNQPIPATSKEQGFLSPVQKHFPLKEKLDSFKSKLVYFLGVVRSIGVSGNLTDYARRKLQIFNLLNFFNLLAGVIVPITGLIQDRNLPIVAWIAAFAPPMISVLVLALNFYKKHEAGMIAYFVLYPVITSVVYLNGINLGVDLFFILYGILAVFFISRISDMLFSIGLSMVSYFMLSVVLKSYVYKLETANFGLYLFNQGLAILLIFYGLFLIKKENNQYENKLLGKNNELGNINKEIAAQKAEIADKANLLEQQTRKLEELNSLKNKLFSVISHDLKAPMYALRNLFQNVQQLDLPGEDIKDMLPEVVNDLNYTTGLMENLLQWAKSQMQANTIFPQRFDIAETYEEVTHALRLSAKAKRIDIKNNFSKPVYVYADRDMINLVLRNLISNAIKFTPEKGRISIQASNNNGQVKISVEDNGIGMNEETLDKLFKEFYTSNGTSNESGTGLGLMLCKEFLAKNDGTISVASQEGKGSNFTFTLPIPKEEYVA
ncbi:MAG: HAMP domain-containing sensor histidine kinase [Chitinophagaceae bacterium]